MPIGYPPDALITRNGTTRRISTAAVTTAVASATFTPGQTVKLPFGNFHGVVVRDLGETVVEAKAVNARLLEQATRVVDAADKRVKAEIAALDAKLAGPPAPKDQAAILMAQEIRSALARMNDADRRKALDAAVEAGDDVVLGAAITGPSILTNIGPAERAARLNAWQKKHKSSELDLRERLEKAKAAMQHAAGLAIKYTGDLTDSALVEQARASAAAARDAIASATVTS